jgi:hypothetical protein
MAKEAATMEHHQNCKGCEATNAAKNNFVQHSRKLHQHLKDADHTVSIIENELKALTGHLEPHSAVRYTARYSAAAARLHEAVAAAGDALNDIVMGVHAQIQPYRPDR